MYTMLAANTQNHSTNEFNKMHIEIKSVCALSTILHEPSVGHCERYK